MRLTESIGRLRAAFCHLLYAFSNVLPGGRISAFGSEPGQIGSIVVINLKRQPVRLDRTMRELNRFRTATGASLVSITKRFDAIDARDGRNVASTGDVDPLYILGDQLFVQPDERLERCFGELETVRMTRQEVAVARSHIEVWKSIAEGEAEYVLIVEDDIWFGLGARSAIDRGWKAAIRRSSDGEGPDLLYLSYSDAGGTAVRKDICRDIFRPERGLWFLSAYVLSRRAASKLLLAMPVRGPVDMWMNRRFTELRAFALSVPAIFQRIDSGSDNSYSVIPFLARAGVIDADALSPPPPAAVGPLLVWCGEDVKESVAMALSMLGLRVRVFDRSEAALNAVEVATAVLDFEALIEPQIDQSDIVSISGNKKIKFLFDSILRCPLELRHESQVRVIAFSCSKSDQERWTDLCELLSIGRPTEPFPEGAPPMSRLFRDDRRCDIHSTGGVGWPSPLSDESAWALRPATDWPGVPYASATDAVEQIVLPPIASDSHFCEFSAMEETFPGNVALFDCQGVSLNGEELTLALRTSPELLPSREFRSGAIVSSAPYHYGAFEAEIKAAKGCGLITGFFLHRASPRQEIDFEITGDDTTSVLLNVYFNPGDSGANFNFGYRGSPCRVPLGFDASEDFHRYSIIWNPDSITWVVDGRVIHRRGSWDPTPVPHLPMKLHLNLWSPRSTELAGRIDAYRLPAKTCVKSFRVSSRPIAGVRNPLGTE